MQPQVQRQETPSPVTLPSPVEKRPRSSAPWILLGVLVLASGGYALYRSASQKAVQGAATAATRTSTVTQGHIEQTIRLTGATGAENFVSLTAPQLRGSRGGGGSGGGSATASTSSTSGTSSTSSTSTGSASSASTSSGSSLSPALQSATSRLSKKTAPTGATSSSGASASSALGADGLGSTSGELNNGGPGGGGGNDFMLILQKLARPGSPVKKGDLVAEFDRENMLNRLDDYKASVAQSEASFRRLQSETEITRKAHEQLIASAKGDLDKARLDMKTIPVLGEMDKERLKLALDEAEARYKQLLAEVAFTEEQIRSQIHSSELSLKQAQLELKRAQANADKMRVRAAISGLAVMESTFRGAEFGQIREGDQVYPGQLFMKIVDTRSMIINASVNQTDVERLRIGQKAMVRFDAYPDLALPATVHSIGAITRPGLFRANFMKEVPVTLKLNKMDPRVIPDLSVSVDVSLASAPESTVAPLAAIQRDAAGAPFVYVREDNGWTRRPVELGLANYTHVTVLSGLKPGEVVALETPVAPEQKQAGL